MLRTEKEKRRKGEKENGEWRMENGEMETGLIFFCLSGLYHKVTLRE
jgi:hypothetical protein